MSSDDPWPTSWPPLPGILDYDLNFVFAKARDSWSHDEWRRYAELLESAGNNLKSALEYYKWLAADRNKRLRRGNKQISNTKLFNNLVSEFKIREPKKRGTKPKTERIKIYEKAIKLQEEGLAKTNKQALVFALKMGGAAEWRAKEQIKNNRMEKGLSEYKQSQKIRN